MKLLSRALTLLLAFSIASCGTVFTGTSEMISINSDPDGAKVSVNGIYMGVTPVTVSLKRDKDHMILVKKDGYSDATSVITRSFNAVSILNTVGLLCWVVDAVTGGMWKFDQSAVSVQLQPIKSASVAPSIVPGKGMKAVKTENGKTAIKVEKN